MLNSYIEIMIIHENINKPTMLTNISRSQITKRSYSHRHAIHYNEARKNPNLREMNSECIISLHLHDLMKSNKNIINDSCFLYLPNLGGSYRFIIKLITPYNIGLTFNDLDIDLRINTRDNNFALQGVPSRAYRHPSSGMFVQSLGEAGYYSTISLGINENEQILQQQSLNKVKNIIDNYAKLYDVDDINNNIPNTNIT